MRAMQLHLKWNAYEPYIHHTVLMCTSTWIQQALPMEDMHTTHMPSHADVSGIRNTEGTVNAF